MSLPDLPHTFGEVHDLLQEMFGVGTYDDVARPEPPFYRTRMNEISRIKAFARKRRVTPEQLGIAAWFAHQTGVHIRQSIRLFPLIPEATRAWKRAIAEESRRQAQVVIDQLIEEALAAGEGEWAERFIRATPAEVPNLTEKWRTR